MIFIRVFLPFAFGYFLSYALRVVNAVIHTDLQKDLSLDAADLGLLTSTYFLTFAIFQLPLGVLLDRYGPRRTEAALLVIAAAGAILFASAQSVSTLIAGRALIGLGVSACLMGAFKAFVMWFPRERIPVMNGYQMTAGGLGALIATAPVEAALNFTDWRGVFYAFAALTFAAAVAIYLMVPEKQSEQPVESHGKQLGEMISVFSDPRFLRIAPLAVMSQASFLSIHGLWAGPWLRDIGGLSRGETANALMLITIALIAGFLTMGHLTSFLQRHGFRPATVAVTAMSLFMGVQVMLALNVTVAIIPIWMLFGFTASSGVLCYALLTHSFPTNLAGRVVTALNLPVFVIAFAGQWGTGLIINLWPVAADGGYHPQGYQVGFGLLLGLQVIALFWYLFYGKARD